MNDYQFGNHLYRLRHQQQGRVKMGKWQDKARGADHPQACGIIPHLRRSAAHGDRHEERPKDHDDRAHRRALRGQDHRDELDSECVH